MFKRITLVIAMALLCILAGCSRRGAVYVPEEPPPVIEMSIPAVLSPPEPEEEPSLPEEPPEIPLSQQMLIAFTFDDGPGDYSAALLDGLAQRGARATFFIATYRVSGSNSHVVLRMHQEGHEVANHTMNHPRLHLLNNDAIRREVDGADEILRGITGVTPRLLRPPYGNFTSRVLGVIDKPVIGWSIDTRDWEFWCHDHVLNEIINNATDGDIILLHEWREHSVTAALEAMDILAERGYRFVTVSELFDARGISLEAGVYYSSANSRGFERFIFDEHDKYPDS